jgi:hypothetical protein
MGGLSKREVELHTRSLGGIVTTPPYSSELQQPTAPNQTTRDPKSPPDLLRDLT